MNYLTAKTSLLNATEVSLPKVGRAVADAFEESLLLTEKISADAFELLETVISEVNLAKSAIPDLFIAAIGLELEKFSSAQKSRLLELFVLHHAKYEQELTRHWIADLVARYFSKDLAKVFIEKLKIADTPKAEHMILLIEDINARREAVNRRNRNSH